MSEIIPHPSAPRPAEQARPSVANIEAEQAVLGALLLNNGIAGNVGSLCADHFYDPVHREIYGLVLRMISEDRLASAVTLKPYLHDHDGLQQLGGLGYLVNMVGAVVELSSLGAYADLIRDLARRRQLLAAMADLEAGLAGSVDVEDAMATFENAIHESGDDTPRSVITFKEAAIRAADRINDAFHQRTVAGIELQIPELSEKIGHVRFGDMVLLAGRPSMGKSAIAMEIARRAARNGIAVVYWCGEMHPEDNAERALSAGAADRGVSVHYHNAARGRLSEGEFKALLEAGRDMESLPFHFIDSAIKSPDRLGREFRREVRRFRKRGFSEIIVVVDYLQKVRAQGRNRYEMVTEASSWIKDLGTELRVVTLVLSQLSRQVEDRDDKRPRLSDLRESGQLEQDANIVLTCYRDEYYLERGLSQLSGVEFDAAKDALERVRGTMEFGILKQRSGPLGTANIRFDAATNSIGERDTSATREQRDFEL